MGLDLYAGPLTRYFCGEWETTLARISRENGTPYKLIRTNDAPPPEPVDPSHAASHVANWATFLSQSLGDNLSSPLSWEDNISRPYDTDQVHWLGYCALLLTAAQADYPQHGLPAVTPQRWDDHPAFAAATADGAKTRFGQVLMPELWLPADFVFTFQAGSPWDGQPIWMGAVPALLAQLNTLNDIVFQAAPEDLEKWRHDGIPQDNALPQCARFGFAVFHHLASFSSDHQLPLKMDY